MLKPTIPHIYNAFREATHHDICKAFFLEQEPMRFTVFLTFLVPKEPASTQFSVCSWAPAPLKKPNYTRQLMSKLPQAPALDR